MISIGFKTDKGIARQDNEDSVFVLPDRNLYMIADGVCYAQGTPLEVLTKENVRHVFGIGGYASVLPNEGLDFSPAHVKVRGCGHFFRLPHLSSFCSLVD